MKLIAENGGDFNRNGFYSGTHALSAFLGDDGKVHAIFNISYGYHVSGENQIMSLGRPFVFDENDGLLTASDGDYAALRYEGVNEERFYVPANTETSECLSRHFADLLAIQGGSVSNRCCCVMRHPSCVDRHS